MLITDLVDLTKAAIGQDFLDTHKIDNVFKNNLEYLLQYGIAAGADFVELFIEDENDEVIQGSKMYPKNKKGS